MNTKTDLLADGVGTINEVVSCSVPVSDNNQAMEFVAANVAAQCTELRESPHGCRVAKFLAVAILNQDFRTTHTLYSVLPNGDVCSERICSEAAQNRIARDIGC